jgi:hypothetical protein
MLALGTAREEPSRPTIGDVDSTPISREEKPEDRDLGHEYMEPFENSPLPPGFKLPFVKNPNLALREAIRGQNIIRTIVLTVSTAVPASDSSDLVGGIINMPFDVKNANATRLDATFWIETVEQKDGSTFLRLQYTQTVGSPRS